MGTTDLSGRNVIARIRTHKTAWHRDDLGAQRRGRRTAEPDVVNTFLVRISLDDPQFLAADDNSAWAAPVAQTGSWADAILAECARTGYRPEVQAGQVVLGNSAMMIDENHPTISFQYVGSLEVAADDGDASAEAYRVLLDKVSER